MNVPDLLTVVGITLDAVGIVLLFWYAPEKYPDHQTLEFFAIEDDSGDEWRKKQQKRK